MAGSAEGQQWSLRQWRGGLESQSMAWWAGVPINGVVGWSPKQWRSGLESQAVAWWAGVPINGVVPDSLANQSISWSMLPDWSVSQLVNDASQSSQWWAQQKGSRVLWEMPVTKKDFKSENEHKRKE